MTPEPQRMRALERANEVRFARSEIKRQIASGRVSAAQVILDCPWEVESWSVGDLLISQRRWGQTRCRKFLVRNEISEVKQIGSLTDRQRRMLASRLSRCDVDAPPEHRVETRVEPRAPTLAETPVEPSIVTAIDLHASKELELVGV